MLFLYPTEIGWEPPAYSLQSALQVRKSMGIQRGKNDKADAKVLARYAYLYRDEIKRQRPPLSQLPSQTLLKVQPGAGPTCLPTDSAW